MIVPDLVARGEASWVVVVVFANSIQQPALPNIVLPSTVQEIELSSSRKMRLVCLELMAYLLATGCSIKTGLLYST